MLMVHLAPPIGSLPHKSFPVPSSCLLSTLGGVKKKKKAGLTPINILEEGQIQGSANGVGRVCRHDHTTAGAAALEGFKNGGAVIGAVTGGGNHAGLVPRGRGRHGPVGGLGPYRDGRALLRMVLGCGRGQGSGGIQEQERSGSTKQHAGRQLQTKGDAAHTRPDWPQYLWMGRRGHNFASAQVYPSGHDREINHCGARRDTRSGRIRATSKVDPFSAMAQPSPQLQVPCPGVARRAIGGQYLLRTITPEERHVREGHACRATADGQVWGRKGRLEA